MLEVLRNVTYPENSFLRHIMERIEHLWLRMFGVLFYYVL